YAPCSAAGERAGAQDQALRLWLWQAILPGLAGRGLMGSARILGHTFSAGDGGLRSHRPCRVVDRPHLSSIAASAGVDPLLDRTTLPQQRSQNQSGAPESWRLAFGLPGS